MSLRRKATSRERGAALIAVVVSLALIGTMTADFAYNAQVDYTSAVNARDDLRAHYLSRSSVNLGRLMLRVPDRLIDPNRRFFGGLDLQIADYAPMLVSAFNSKEGAEALGALLGVEGGGIKGIGVDVGSFDLNLESLDGKVNLNCGGGANTGAPQVVRFAATLGAMFLPQRYNQLFENPDDEGQYADRLEVLRAIIDWSDQDTVIFGSSAAEDYRYNARKDPYEIKNQYFDTVEELRLVKGVGDAFMESFGNSFTVYGGCQVNVGLADAPTLTALIIQHAASPTDPALEIRNLALLVRYVIAIRDLMAGFADAKAFQQAVENPLAQLGVASSADALLGAGRSDRAQAAAGLPPVVGIKLNPKITEAIVAGVPRRIWRITASAKVGRIKKRIIAVWDGKHISSQAARINFGPGAFHYWREE